MLEGTGSTQRLPHASATGLDSRGDEKGHFSPCSHLIAATPVAAGLDVVTARAHVFPAAALHLDRLTRRALVWLAHHGGNGRRGSSKTPHSWSPTRARHSFRRRWSRRRSRRRLCDSGDSGESARLLPHSALVARSRLTEPSSATRSPPDSGI